MKKLIITGLLGLLTANVLNSAEYDLDYAVFRGSEDLNVVEVYLLLPRKMLKFVPVQNYFESGANLRVALVQSDTVVDIFEWQIVDRIADTLQIRSQQKIPDIATLQAKAGAYQLIAVITDLNSGRQYKETCDLTLPDYGQTSLKMSDVQLSSQVAKTAKENKFSKYYGYDIVPNANLIFGDQVGALYAFAEVYNLKYDPLAVSDYKIKYAITDLNGKEVKALDWLTKRKPGNSAVEIKSIDIRDLNAGVYNFNIQVIDLSSQQQSASSKRFYIARESAPVGGTMSSLADLKLEGKSAAELDEIFGPLKYVATDVEIKRFKKSDVPGKKEIILHFWDKRDKNPRTPVNEDQIEFERRLDYVNQQFSTQRIQGWKSDFGRVYLVYGPPSEIERFPSALERKPYQIWHYHALEGGVQFIFVDKSGFGQYELVHSTARNELQDVDWERWIEPNSSSPNIQW